MSRALARLRAAIAELGEPPLQLEVRPGRLYGLVAVAVAVELIVFLWIAGALRPLSAL